LIDISHKEYNIPNDDRLNDSISGIISISLGFGETIGPIVGSFLPKLFDADLKYRITYFIISLIFMIYGVFYLTLDRFFTKKQEIDSKLIEEEELLPIH
jgi:MFS family permease